MYSNPLLIRVIKMSNREVVTGKEARQNLVAALNEIADAVSPTMGPGGMAFGYDKAGIDGQVTSTWSKDGLTVLRALRPTKPVVQAVLQYAKQAASHSVLASGDGTSSSIVMAAAVANAIAKSNAVFPQAFARELERDANAAIEAIKKEAIRSDEAGRIVALTSTNGDSELTDVVMDALKLSSAYGTLLVEKIPSSKVRYNIVRQDGYSHCNGYMYDMTFAQSASAETSAFRPIVWENPLVALVNGLLMQKEQLKTILDAWNTSILAGDRRSLVIYAHEVSTEVTNNLLGLNRHLAAQGVACFVVKPLMSAEINSTLQVMRDYAAYCGVAEDKIIDVGNIKSVDLSYMGSCGKITIGLNSTAIIGRATNHWVEERVRQNLSVIAAARSPWDKELATLRNSELAEGLVKVEVGGGHLGELQERADRFDDASKACQAYMKSGALPGGGCSYIRAGILAGVHPALAEAFRSVYENVLQNYGVQPDDNFMPLRGKSIHLENDGCTVVDAVEGAVLDSVDTVCSVIKNGVILGSSVALMGGYCFRDQTEV